ncbi:DNA cytosine methyltransferase [Eubacterium sp.]
MDKVKVGSLFSGIGGIDLGFEQAGFEIAWANDFDAAACKTYRNNFPSTILIEDDVRNINPCALSDIDVLVAGFPCQPFSVMGYRRGFNDPRGNLFFEIARFIDVKRPKVVFLENVKNLMEHDNGKTFLVIYNALAQFGYSVKYKVINATDVNIPQNRARIFIVAFRDIEDCDKFSFPQYTPLEATIDDVIDRSIKHDDIYYYGSESRYFKELNAKIVDKTGIYRIDDSGIATRKWEICPTLKANMGTYHDRVPIIRDDFGIRMLTPMECLAFQGYPKKYTFKGVSLKSAYKQCGNTVCVPIIKSIAAKLFELM